MGPAGAFSVSEQFRWRPQGRHSSGIAAPRRPQASRTSPQVNPLRSSALVSRRFSASSGARPWSLAAKKRSICPALSGACSRASSHSYRGTPFSRSFSRIRAGP